MLLSKSGIPIQVILPNGLKNPTEYIPKTSRNHSWKTISLDLKLGNNFVSRRFFSFSRHFVRLYKLTLFYCFLTFKWKWLLKTDDVFKGYLSLSAAAILNWMVASVLRSNMFFELKWIGKTMQNRRKINPSGLQLSFLVVWGWFW